MKKLIFLISAAFLFYSCKKDMFSPSVSLANDNPNSAPQYYPETLKWIWIEGDTLFPDTLVMKLRYPLMISAHSTADYDFNYPIWNYTYFFFVGPIPENEYKISFINSVNAKQAT